MARALALAKGHEVEEVEALRDGHDEDDGLDLSDRCWWDGIDEIWMTNCPPPARFAGYESRPYDEYDDDEPYERVCTDEEAAILNAERAADHAAERTEEEELRDRWFEFLKSELSELPVGI